MSRERCHEVKEGEKGLIREMKTLIFVDEPYGCEAVEFYKYVFGAIEWNRTYEQIETGDEIMGSVRVLSSELQFGSSNVIVSELTPNSSWLKKKKLGSRTPRGIMYVYMEDVDAVVALALELGAVEEFRDFDCDGACINADVRDPYGILWCIRPACMMSDIVVEGSSGSSSSKDSPAPPKDITKETEEEEEEIRKKTRFF